MKYRLLSLLERSVYFYKVARLKIASERNVQFSSGHVKIKLIYNFVPTEKFRS
ncbi:hypothetical protein SAMN05192545_0893 [Maribacter dokdonensis]|uniref:Uncharacterized protein n=1 Tax=Maribacter dokdonensis TaxID=320912 RepID=A0ABY0U6V2_9FLAO|nr:hypothetical protein SAMN05192545_0893 [Maribacter dokdonensis]